MICPQANFFMCYHPTHFALLHACQFLPKLLGIYNNLLSIRLCHHLENLFVYEHFGHTFLFLSTMKRIINIQIFHWDKQIYRIQKIHTYVSKGIQNMEKYFKRLHDSTIASLAQRIGHWPAD